MRLRILTIALVVLSIFAYLPRCFAIGAVTVFLRSVRPALLADGKQTTVLRADVRDSSGRPVPENTQVRFTLNGGGSLSPSLAQTHGGIATTTLTSSPIAGQTIITATAPGGISQPLTILFTDDPEATFEGNNYMLLTGSSYLAYSATDKAVEAIGKDGGARLAFRNIEIHADRLQLRCADLIVRARDNVILKRAGKTLKANKLYYSIQSGDGYAIAELDGRMQPVQISGEIMRVEASKTPIPTSYTMIPELQVKLNIVAKSITYFPNEKLQFRRPKFFQDQAQILSLPYYELGLYSTELFTDQFVSVGTSGFGLELPFYYNLSPKGDGIVYLRHQQPLGRGYYATQPGWAVDVVQGYSSQGDHRYEGSYGFSDLTRGDWSFRFNHNQEFDSKTQGSFDLEFPQHDSIFSAANFSHQLKEFRIGANFSGGQTFTSDKTTSSQANFFADTLPHTFFAAKGYQYTFGTNFTSGQTRTTLAGITNYNQSSENVNVRIFSKPIILDKRTTFNNSFTFGHTWSDTGGTGFAALATLTLDHTLPGLGAINLTYDYVNQPRDVFTSGGRQRVSATYTVQGTKRFQAFVFGSAFLDAPEASILGDVSYKLDSRWRLIGAVTLQRFEGESYNDIEFIVGRRIGTRELQLAYSTFTRRISFDFTATRF